MEEIVGEVTQEAAEVTGLYPELQYGGAVDFCASCVASGVIEEGDIQMNLVLVVTLELSTRPHDFLREMLVCAHAVSSRSTYVTIPQLLPVGNSCATCEITFLN